MIIKVYNIDYDTDGIEIDLPNELTINVPKNINDEADIDEYLSDEISNQTGFCHKGFDSRVLLSFTSLKHGKFTSPQSGDAIIWRYIIETAEDLKAFLKKIEMLSSQKIAISEIIAEGHTIILTDPNIMGFPSYCLETKDKNNTHSTCFYRVLD